MRLENLEKQKHLQHYKRLYGAECKTVAKLNKTIIFMQNDISLLQQENQKLKQKIVALPE